MLNRDSGRDSDRSLWAEPPGDLPNLVLGTRVTRVHPRVPLPAPRVQRFDATMNRTMLSACKQGGGSLCIKKLRVYGGFDAAWRWL